MPGYEDVWYYLWKERRLPVNVDPLDRNAEGRGRAPAARARVRARPEHGGRLRAAAARREDPDAPAGWRWRSGPWFFRSEHMFLIPGDSPMGYRLPLDCLPWVARRRSRDADRARSVRAAPAAAAPPRDRSAASRRSPGAARRPAAGRAAGDRPPGLQTQTLEPREPSRPAAAPRRIRRRHRPHRAVRRAARGPAARLPAAGARPPKTTSSWSPRSKTPPARCDLPVLIEG